MSMSTTHPRNAGIRQPLALTLAVLFLISASCTGSTNPILPADAAADGTTQTDVTRENTGRVTYLKRVGHETGDGMTVITAAPRIVVELLNASGDVIGETTTDDAGNFGYDPDDGVTGVAALARSRGPRVNVSVYRAFPSNGVDEPVRIVGGLDLIVSEKYDAGAFNVVAQTVRLGRALTGIVSDEVPAELQVRYADGVTLPNCPTCFFATSFRMELTGQAGDEDAHDDSVVLHELGHYAEAAFGRYSNPGGKHDLEYVRPPLAWSEGFATWLQAAVRGTGDYIDVWPIGGPYTLDLESPPASTNGTEVEGDPSSNYSEGLVFGLLWDLTDGDPADPASDDDPLAVGPGPVFSAAFAIKTGPDRGGDGADLVDFVDRWQCAMQPALAEMLAAVSFPYQSADCP
ncbi:MAG: hypothetical protein ACI9OJ_006073 [Myxococcota bacterium]|jgi:hypothetical protein